MIPEYPTHCKVEWVDAEDPLFLLYTSGSTGKPKVCIIKDVLLILSFFSHGKKKMFFPVGKYVLYIFSFFFLKGVLHTTGGYMVYTATTFKYAFDYKPTDIYWSDYPIFFETS